MNPLNECGACGLDFASVKSFDAHRVGVHAYTFKEGLAMDSPREDGRRCLDLDELLAGSYRGRRFVRDARGRYVLASTVGVARAAFGAAQRGQSDRLAA